MYALWVLLCCKYIPGQNTFRLFADDLTERHWLPETRDQFGEIVVEDSSSDEDLDQLDVEDDEQDNEEVTIRLLFN